MYLKFQSPNERHATSNPLVRQALQYAVDRGAIHAAAARIVEDVALIPLIELRNAYYHSARVRNCFAYIPLNSLGDPASVWLAQAGR